MSLTREQLYDLVWSQSINSLAKHLGVSNVALKKQCRRLHVPVPGRGYWAKKRAGQRPRKTPLPARPTGVPATARRSAPEGAVVRPASPIAVPQSTIEEFEALLRAELGDVRVRTRFYKTHPALRSRIERWRAGSAAAMPWDHARIDGFKEQKRRLLMLNALLLGFDRLGYQAWLNGRSVQIAGPRHFGFTIGWLEWHHGSADQSRPAKRGWSIISWKIWRDEPGSPLEDRLTEIVVDMMIAAEEYRRQRAQRDAEERERTNPL